MRPLATVDKVTFRNMLRGFSSKEIFIPDRRALVKHLEEWFDCHKSKMIEIIKQLEFVCTTADIWSSFNKSFMGMTLHYIDDESLKRVSKLLALRRFTGKHMYVTVANSINTIHKDYELDAKKITDTVTDSASNFDKAFRIFGIEVGDAKDDQKQAQSDEEIEEVNFVNLDDILTQSLRNVDEEEDEMQLPRHLKCAAHSLSLVATTDVKKAEDSPRLKQIYRSTFTKIQAFWNKLSRSTVASDKCIEICGCKFPVPNKTR